MGDNERRLASNAMFYLNKLVERHPVMKAVVIDEVEHLLYRPNVTAKAKYYALCFLSQVPLGDEDADVATKLLAVYLSLFSTLTAAPSSTGVKNELQPNTPKMLSSLLTGVNRAFPYASDTSSIEKQIDVLFRLVHVSSFPTATQVPRGELATFAIFTRLQFFFTSELPTRKLLSILLVQYCRQT